MHLTSISDKNMPFYGENFDFGKENECFCYSDDNFWNILIEFLYKICNLLFEKDVTDIVQMHLDLWKLQNINKTIFYLKSSQSMANITNKKLTSTNKSTPSPHVNFGQLFSTPLPRLNSWRHLWTFPNVMK